MYNLTSNVDCKSFEDILTSDKQALLLVTGGLDSAYMLYTYAQQHSEIHCYHIKSDSARWQTEWLALNSQIEYLRKRNTTIHLHTSSYSGPEGWMIRDWYAAAFLSIGIALKHNLSYIVVGDDLPDSYKRSQSYSSLPEKQRNEIISLSNFISAYSSGKVSLCTALEASNLSELYNAMPSDYVSLVFSCRKPIQISLNNKVVFRPCGLCNSCYKNEHFGWYDKIRQQFVLDDLSLQT